MRTMCLMSMKAKRTSDPRNSSSRWLWTMWVLGSQVLLTSVPSLQPYIYNQKRPNTYLLSGHNRLALQPTASPCQLHPFYTWALPSPHFVPIQRSHSFFEPLPKGKWWQLNSLASALLVWLPFIHIRGKPSLFHILYPQVINLCCVLWFF